MPGRYFGYWAIFCGFFAGVFAIACFATDRWYVIEMPGPITVSLGLRTMCIRSDFSQDTSTGNVDSTVVSTALGGGEDKCGILKLDVEKIKCPAGSGFSNITATEAYSRTNATLGLAATGATLMVLCFFYIVALACMSDTDQMLLVKAVGFFFSFMSMICCVTGMALYYHTMDFWMYCGLEFCSFWNTLSPCDSSFGYSFYFLVFAVILSCFVALSLLFGCCNALRGKDSEEERVKKNRQAMYEQQNRDQREMIQQGSGGQQQKQKQKARDPYAVGLDNTWVYDADSDYWWSDNEQLYYDEASGHYYDAESGQWFDPEKEEWYQP